MSGLFISFEGVEGAGKTTQIKLFHKYLEGKGYKVILTREPGGTPIGEKIREVLLDPENKEMNYMTELLLYCASRAQHLHEKILKKKKEGYIVICDRFSDSSLAYQGYARGIDIDLIEILNKTVVGDNMPDMTILIDIDPEKSLDRAIKSSKQEGGDRIEQEKIEFHKRVWQGFREIARKDPKRVKTFDGDLDISEIHEKIVRSFEEFYN